MSSNTGRHGHQQRSRRAGWSLAMLPVLFAAPYATANATDITLPPVSIGAGLRTSFTSTNTDDPAAQDANDFNLDSARLYINGAVMKDVKFMLNTEYTNTGAGDKKVDIIDAVARFEFSDQFNIWAGRFLPPSDRANLYGPYYASNWAVYSDGVQDGYPFKTTGRDDGVAYWGQFDKLKVSIGAFDSASTTGKSDVIGAARVQLDLWDPEPGYYLNGTYYGDKDLLAFGLAGQTTSTDTAWSGDFLMEKKLGGAGVVGLESEYTFYNGLGGYDGNYGKSKGWYVLADYLFPQQIGIGKFQLLGKYAHADFESGATSTDVDYAQKTTEVDLNYIIKTFNARMSLFYKDTSYDAVQYDFSQIGLGLQVQI